MTKYNLTTTLYLLRFYHIITLHKKQYNKNVFVSNKHKFIVCIVHFIQEKLLVVLVEITIILAKKKKYRNYVEKTTFYI